MKDVRGALSEASLDVLLRDISQIESGINVDRGGLMLCHFSRNNGGDGPVVGFNICEVILRDS